MTNPVQSLDDFELRHLLTHLEASGRVDDLHRLLALDFVPTAAAQEGALSRLWAALRRRPRPASERRVNAWHDAKNAADRLDEYVADVRRGWRLAEEGSLAAIHSSGRSATLGAELRYAAIIGSLTTIGTSVTPLLAALVECGIWSAPRALAQARRPGANGQMEWSETGGAVELLHTLAKLGHTSIALESARSFPDRALRPAAIGAVGSVSGAQTKELLSEALAAARSIDDHEQRAHAVEKLAPYLDEQTVAAGAALLAPTRDANRVGWAVRSLARRMAQVGRSALAVDLVLTPWSLTGDGQPQLDQVVLSRAAEELAEFLAVEQVRRLIERLADPALAEARADVLAALAPYVPKDLLAPARKLASTVGNEFARARLVPLLVDGEASTLRKRALAAAAGADRESRHRVLLCIALRQAGSLRDQLLRDAAAAAIDSEFAESRAEDLLRVLAQCGKDLRDELGVEALKRCKKINQPFRRSHALEKLALLVAEPLRGEVLRHALHAAAESGNTEREAAIARLMGSGAVREVLAKLQTIADDTVPWGTRAFRAGIVLRNCLLPDVDTFLAATTTDLSDRNDEQFALDRAAEGLVALGRASDTLAAIDMRGPRPHANALAALIRRLPFDLLDRAAKLVQRVRPDYDRADSQAALGIRFVEAGRLDEGYRLCRELVDAKPSGGMEYVAKQLVRDAAPLLASRGQVDLALALCEACKDAEARTLAAANCAEYAEATEARRLLAAAIAWIDRARPTGHAYFATELAGALVRGGMIDDALRIAAASPEPVRVLARIASYVAEPRQSEIIAAARRQAAEAFETSRNRLALMYNLESLLLVAPVGRSRDAILGELIAQIDAETALGITDYRLNSTPLETQLSFLARFLAEHDPPRGYEIWRRVLHDASSRGRSRLTSRLGELAPLCAALATPEARQDIVQAVEHVSAWWP